jgi:threonine aldolase
LLKLAEGKRIEADYYSLGGSIQELESKFARLIGKESAVFMPTGTLANHLAIRVLAGGHGRVILQSESHLYNDSGDCAQTLSNLNLIPLANNKATFTLQEVEEVLAKTATGRVATPVAVISIESPVRRKAGEMFDFEEMKRISSFARKNNIRLHLDGARIFLASAYTGIAPSEYASLFDTVYVSLWKYFNAASGAILAGPKGVIENMFHTRRMFGSGLPAAWTFAAVALNYMDGFTERFKEAIKVSEDLIRRLKGHPNFLVERIPAGTNVFRLQVKGVDANAYVKNLKDKNVLVSPPAEGSNVLALHVNETLNRMSASELAGRLIQSLPV